MNICLDTRQKVDSFRHAHPNRDVKIGDMVELRGESWCPICFHRHEAGTDETLECFRNFPPVVRVTVTGALNCATCDNVMLLETFHDGRKVIMCCNPHCPDQGTCYKMPTIRLERLFE